MRGFALLLIKPGHKDINCKKVFSSWPWRSIMNRFNEDVLSFLPGSRTGNGTMMKEKFRDGICPHEKVRLFIGPRRQREYLWFNDF
jgi:hypothetical protein